MTYFFAADDALPIPGFHLFGNGRDFLNHGCDELGPGEVPNVKRVYYNGAMPGYFPGNGSFCGSLEQWESGTASNATRLNYHGIAEAPCCPQRPCQPWFFGDVLGTFVLQESTGLTWTVFGDFSNQFQAADPSNPVNFIEFDRDNGHVCRGFDATTGFVQVSVGPFVQRIDLNLISWDSSASTGRWQVPVNPFGYGGEFFQFHRLLA